MTMIPAILLLLAQVTGPERVLLTGTVVDSDGRPAAGIAVVLADDPPWRRLGVAVRSSGAVLRPAAVMSTQRTDAEGRFRIERPEPGWSFSTLRRRFFLWAIGPAGALALRPIPDDWPPDGPSLRLTMARPEPLRLRVLDPEGRPAAGVRLAPARARDVDVPAELDDRLAAATDENGRATLNLGMAGEIEVIRALSGSSGTQQFRLPRPDDDGVRTLRLRPVGRVTGRIEAGDPAAARGLAVRIRTDPEPMADLSGEGGFAAVATDDSGRFAVPAIAAGTLRLSFETRWDLPWRGTMAGRPAVRPGSTTEVAIALKRAVRIEGVVQETPGGRPLAGAAVVVATGLEIPPARSDAQGRYSSHVAPPGVAYGVVALAPRGYFAPSGIIRNTRRVAEGMPTITMDPIGLVRGVELQGRVVDARGEPVPCAEISGEFDLSDGRPRAVHAVADRRGQYRIYGLPQATTVRLSASGGGATTAAPVSIRSGDGAVTLAVSRENAVALFGRVKDQDGRPVAGAEVRVSGRQRGPAGPLSAEVAVAFDDEGRKILRTGPDGLFRTPKRLRPDLDYRIEVAADGFNPAGTEWIQPVDRKFESIATVVLRPAARTRTVAGRVVDARGLPIPGAVVFQSGDGPARTRTTTDGEGRFRLPGVYREAACLFVEGSGLAFEGHRIGAGDEAVVLEARREGEPRGQPLHTLPSLRTRDQEIALGRRLIGDDFGPLTGPESTPDTVFLLRALPRLDFERAWDLAERPAIASPIIEENLRWECALAMAATDFEEAAAIAETLKSPRDRSSFYRMACNALPQADRSRRVEWLTKALAHVRAETDSESRIPEVGMIGVRLLDLGEAGQGTEVLREAQRLVDSLPRAAAGRPGPLFARVRAEFASRLARIDARAAFALLEGLPDRDLEEYRCRIALALADRDPAGSEQAFSRRGDRVWRDRRVIRAVGRMAPIDRERARRLVETLAQPSDQALALGSMASSLAATDPAAASALIDEALIRLEKLVQAGGDGTWPWACVAAGHLLPTAERLDAGLLRRAFWRAVAMRPPRPPGGDPSGRYEEGIAELAITLARYDRDVAHQVLEPAAARARSLVERARANRGYILFAAAAAIDPAWAAALADSLPDDPPGSSLHPRATVRRVIAQVLAYDGPGRWEHLESYYLPFSRDSRVID